MFYVFSLIPFTPELTLNEPPNDGTRPPYQQVPYRFELLTRFRVMD
jgi:hypothetical protein